VALGAVVSESSRELAGVVIRMAVCAATMGHSQGATALCPRIRLVTLLALHSTVFPAQLEVRQVMIEHLLPEILPAGWRMARTTGLRGEASIMRGGVTGGAIGKGSGPEYRGRRLSRSDAFGMALVAIDLAMLSHECEFCTGVIEVRRGLECRRRVTAVAVGPQRPFVAVFVTGHAGT
jgi:hypothetical protein